MPSMGIHLRYCNSWKTQGGCDNGAQIDSRWKKHYHGDRGHNEKVPDSFQTSFFHLQPKHGARTRCESPLL